MEPTMVLVGGPWLVLTLFSSLAVGAICDSRITARQIGKLSVGNRIEIAYRMFERWRQENFFKYMREEFLLDALVDYQIEPEDPTRTIPNPERRVLHKEMAATLVLVECVGRARDQAAGRNVVLGRINRGKPMPGDYRGD
jgi:hypothetical protein